MSDQSEEFVDGERPEDDSYTLDRHTIAAILQSVDTADRNRLVELMEPLHAADIADLLEQINSYDRDRLIHLYGIRRGNPVRTGRIDPGRGHHRPQSRGSGRRCSRTGFR